MSRFAFYHLQFLLFASGKSPLAVLVLALSLTAGAAPFTAFNDHVPGLGTGSNVTTYGPGQEGPLKDWSSGVALPVQVTVTTNAALPNTIEGHPFYGHPGFGGV